MSKTCKNCVFRVPDKEGYGICHRYPPMSILDANAVMMSQFPLVEDSWWCGEWKLKEERFEELLHKSLDDNLTDEEAEELSTLALERSRPLLESEAKYLGKLTEISRSNDELIQQLRGENREQTE